MLACDRDEDANAFTESRRGGMTIGTGEAVRVLDCFPVEEVVSLLIDEDDTGFEWLPKLGMVAGDCEFVNDVLPALCGLSESLSL